MVMEYEIQNIVHKVQGLSDIELAVLLCFVAEQQCCIIEADIADLDDVESEIKLIAQETFGVQYAAIDFNASTTLDDFGRGLLVPDEQQRSSTPGAGGDYINSAGTPTSRRHFLSPKPFERKSEGRIANVVIARGLNTASEQVQIQALELIRSKRIFTRKEIHTAPEPFLLIALYPTGGMRLWSHLNDHMFISHVHPPSDPLPNLDAPSMPMNTTSNDAASSSASSLRSVIHTPPATPGPQPAQHAPSALVIPPTAIATLVTLANAVSMSPDVRAYLHDLVVFLRTHRAVGRGISALATRHLNLLARVLAPLHGLGFVTPSLVALAVRKVYRHRVVLVQPDREVSLLWGSDVRAVEELLRGVSVEEVLEEVLSNVDTPL